MAGVVQPGMVLRPSAAGAHIHVVLSHPFGEDRHALVVNWTTLDDACVDEACVLQSGDHPTIHHASTLAFSRAHLWREDKILFALANGSLQELPPASPALLARMAQGARSSPELRKEWKALLPPP